MPSSNLRQRLQAGLLAATALMTACAGYSPSGLVPGSSTAADATQSMGPPTGRYPLPNGGERLEFARGPMGRETYMLDFDAQGRLTGSEQVLTEKRFNQLLPGMRSEALLPLIGRPSETGSIPRQHQTVWSYRYESPSLMCRWFQIGIDPQGRVVDTGYYPDPLCGDNKRDMLP